MATPSESTGGVWPRPSNPLYPAGRRGLAVPDGCHHTKDKGNSSRAHNTQGRAPNSYSGALRTTRKACEKGNHGQNPKGTSDAASQWGSDTPPVVYDGMHLVETSDRNPEQQGASLVQTTVALRKSRRHGRQHEPATVGPTGNTSQREQHPAHGDSRDKSAYLELRPSLDIIYMLDTHVSIPNTVWNDGAGTPPCNPWTELPLWDGHCAEEYHIYTDGSSGARGTGGAAVLFVKLQEKWHWGGFLLTNIPEKGAHVAEMAGLCTALLWVWCSTPQAAYRPAPEVHIHFDATAAGWRIQGRWRGRVHQERTNRMRHLITLSETRYRTRHHFHHVKGHSGQWGNDLADYFAGCAAGTPNTDPFPWWFLTESPEEAMAWTWLAAAEEWSAHRCGARMRLCTAQSTTHGPAKEAKEVDELGRTMQIHLKLASANVLTLHPQKDEDKVGIGGSGRHEAILGQAHAAGVHLLGMQETRMQTGRTRLPHYHIIYGAATKKGHGGMQLAINVDLPYAMTGDTPNYLHPKRFGVLYDDDTMLIVTMRCPGATAVIIVGHGPHSGSDDQTLIHWWQRLQQRIRQKYTGWPTIALIDANARLGSVNTCAVGEKGAQEECRAGKCWHDFLLDNNMWLPATFSETHRGRDETWHHPGTQKASRIDYIALSVEWSLDKCNAYTTDEIDLSMTWR